MSSKEIEKSIKNLEDNIVNVQGDVCEGLYSNIIEVSNNLQSNLDEVNIRTNDRITNIPGVDSKNIPNFVNNFKNNLKISVDDFVTFVRYFNLINSKINVNIAKKYKLVFSSSTESIINNIESNSIKSKLNEEYCMIENIEEYISDCSLDFRKEIKYLNNIIKNSDNFFNMTNNQNNPNDAPKLVLLKKELIILLREVDYVNNIFGNIEIMSKSIEKWWKESLLLYGLSYDYVDLHLQGYSIEDLVKITLPNANEFSMNSINNNLNNITNIHYLNQNDFDNGPIIIREPGIYKLETNIEFSPFPTNNGKPTKEWLNTLLEDEKKAFVLGVFAAIIIRSDNVCLDLNGKTFKQSKKHFFQQTFYSHVEMASSPFILGQGPADFGKKVDEANQVFITNGTFGLSSHHAIHGNLCKNCIFSNLKFENFAVAAIHLNGSHNVIVDNVVADNKNINIEINSLFSQAQFILELLNSSNINDDDFITIQGKNKTTYDIKNSLRNDIMEVYESIENPEYVYRKIFLNEGGKLDANVYGMVFNTKGIAINDFKDIRENNTCGNSNIVLNNVSIKNIESKGTEIKVLSDQNSIDSDAYGSGGFVGPAGDVFDYVKASDENGFYKSNCLSDAQLLAAKYSLNKRVNIPEPIREWAADGLIKIGDVIKDNKYYVLCKRDSMNHVMKGNIGLFIQQAYRVVANNLSIENICNTSISNNIDPASSYGILFSGTEDVLLTNYKINNIKSGAEGLSEKIFYKKTNKNINV